MSNLTRSDVSVLVLFGSPAAGKDTVTGLLEDIGRFSLARRYKMGTGRTKGYVPVLKPEYDQLHQSGMVVSEVERYGNRYLLTSLELRRISESDRIAVVHTASVDEYESLPDEWGRVLLLASREATIARLIARGDTDFVERLELYDLSLIHISEPTRPY